MDSAEQAGAILDQPKGNAEAFGAAHIVGGAIDRIHDPGQLTGSPTAFLADETVFGERLGQAVGEERLDRAIGFR